MRVDKLDFHRAPADSDWSARVRFDNGYEVEVLTPSRDRASAVYSVLVVNERGALVAGPGESIEAGLALTEEQANSFLEEVESRGARPPSTQANNCEE